MTILICREVGAALQQNPAVRGGISGGSTSRVPPRQARRPQNGATTPPASRFSNADETSEVAGGLKAPQVLGADGGSVGACRSDLEVALSDFSRASPPSVMP